MNDVLSVVGVVERSKPSFGFDRLDSSGANDPLNPSEEDATGEQLSNAAILDYGILTSWHSALVMRLLVFYSFSKVGTYTDHSGLSPIARHFIY
jgi:hypothetical protein